VSSFPSIIIPIVPIAIQTSILMLTYGPFSNGGLSLGDIIMYHLWCSSNSLMDDSVRLHIFQISMDISATN
jgi:hypothetical protein